MTHNIPDGTITIPKTDFLCPTCGTQYGEDFYYKSLYVSKRGYIWRTCTCGVKLGITADIKGDVVVWQKVTKNG